MAKFGMRPVHPDSDSTLDPGTFGNTQAAKDLASRLGRTGDILLIRRTASTLEDYNKGLQEIIKTDSPFRDGFIDLYYKNHLEKCDKHLGPRYVDHDIPVSYVKNLMKHRARQAKLHGDIIERMHYGMSSRDYKQTIQKLISIERRFGIDKLNEI